MSRIIFSLVAVMAFSLSSFAQDMTAFNKRFELVKNEQGKVTAIRLKKAVTTFTIRPFLEQIKADLKREQNEAFVGVDSEEDVDQMLMDMGLNPYSLVGENGSEEAQKIKEALLNIKNINVDEAFAQADDKAFWKEFETKLKEAWLFVDPSVMANLDDAQFFYKRQVTYRVVEWALQTAAKRFSSVPVLNIVTFMVVRIHDMMLEQRHFSHNMLLHYFETIPESKLGMTKEEVDRAVSSIYEYRIDAMSYNESKKAAANWATYGFDKFYADVRMGNSKIRQWQSPLASTRFSDIKKLDYAFASVMENNARKIYHLHITAHQFTQKPALAYDYSNPQRVKRNRALLNLAGVVLGFINIPDWLKGNVDNFIKSMYVQQVRMEGALVGYFETTGDTAMMKSIYAQRANFYIVE